MSVLNVFILKNVEHTEIFYTVLYLNGTTNESALVRALTNIKPFSVKPTEVLRNGCFVLDYIIMYRLCSHLAQFIKTYKGVFSPMYNYI